MFSELQALIALAEPEMSEIIIDLGTVVRCRDRGLRALRWPAEDHRQHRGAAAHCEDTVAPGACSAGAVSERAAARGAGAADTIQAAVNRTMSRDSVAG